MTEDVTDEEGDKGMLHEIPMLSMRTKGHQNWMLHMYKMLDPWVANVMRMGEK